MTWEPHTVVDDVLVDPAPIAALVALLDDGLPPVLAGDDLPPLWHWVALPRWVRSSLGPDGHPARGGFLPPIDLPRRMFAGGEVRLRSSIPVGATVRREVGVTGVERKAGRSGELVVVTVVIRLFTGERLALEETQNLIYRGAPPGGPPEPGAVYVPPDLPPGVPLQRTGEWSWSLRTDASLLMRFSAATANPHRIHDDHPYATQVEGYPGLVVHGPLMTLALAEVLRLEDVTGVSSLAHRNLAPLYCGTPATMRRVESDGDGFTLQLLAPDGDDEGPRTTLTLRLS